MLNGFNSFIKGNGLAKEGDKILLAVSGGIDSMAMAHLFLMAGYQTAIAHCNFSLRGKDSDMDEDLVRQFASCHNIPFFSTRFDTKKHSRDNGLSIQMAARELRYIWFEKIMNENNYDLLSVAHNLNDNVETFIINLIRGTGIAGLAGMKPLSNRIIRPLLFATRRKIEIFCSENNISYREDLSNEDTKYTRNKIRHKIIPVLKEINPSIETTLNETAERIAGINEIVNNYISEIREKVSEDKGELTSFSISKLLPFIQNRTILFELFKPFGITGVMLSDLVSVIEGKTGNQLFTSTHRIVKNRKEIILSHEGKLNNDLFLIDDLTDFLKVPGIESAWYEEASVTYEISSDRFSACIDAEKIKFPLTVRKWKPGDRFYPLGMKHQKKLSDYFIDCKYSILEKENKLILESEGRIIWIIGDRLDNRFRITAHTKKALILKSAKKAMRIIPLK
jgi:tRNA(Ile)-lysidine synthase